MTTCTECAHWNLKKAEQNMARMGFGQCEKKALAGYTTSAQRSACEKFAALDADKVAARRQWLEKQK